MCGARRPALAPRQLCIAAAPRRAARFAFPAPRHCFSRAVFSTIIHSLPQLFSANPLDADSQNIYLPRQIEPEEQDFSVRFRVREFLNVFAVPNLAGRLKDFATQRTRRNRFTAIPPCAEFGSSEKLRCREQPATASPLLHRCLCRDGSEAWRFGLELVACLAQPERSAESTSSQVVRISLEDAISRKAVGSPD